MYVQGHDQIFKQEHRKSRALLSTSLVTCCVVDLDFMEYYITFN